MWLIQKQRHACMHACSKQLGSVCPLCFSVYCGICPAYTTTTEWSFIPFIKLSLGLDTDQVCPSIHHLSIEMLRIKLIGRNFSSKVSSGFLLPKIERLTDSLRLRLNIFSLISIGLGLDPCLGYTGVLVVVAAMWACQIGLESRWNSRTFILSPVQTDRAWMNRLVGQLSLMYVRSKSQTTKAVCRLVECRLPILT